MSRFDAASRVSRLQASRKVRAPEGSVARDGVMGPNEQLGDPAFRPLGGRQKGVSRASEPGGSSGQWLLLFGVPVEKRCSAAFAFENGSGYRLEPAQDCGAAAAFEHRVQDCPVSSVFTLMLAVPTLFQQPLRSHSDICRSAAGTRPGVLKTALVL
ncbi:hypothetical protein [Rhodovulum sulfidophilum]|uniref:hypothetical protein n=1 Tax=Rhodovulum sulfidophilum TaxID=35806 RepID=UPI00117BAB3D|nr:hypothetical protein [Rhodovulum sulfidophilum]